MKKNNFLMFALVAVLTGSMVTFTSCVDDTESDSVSNIRNSQAELMRAEATLLAAQAEVARTLATAEAALMAAQARQADAEATRIAALAKQAEAEANLIEAQVAHQLAQTEIERERAAAELERAQIANAQAELALENARVQAEVARTMADLAIAQAEIQLEQAKLLAEVEMRNLQNQLDMLNINDPVLQEAIFQYQTFIAQVNQLTSQIASSNLSLMRAEALLADNFASIEEQAARTIRWHNSNIEGFERSIAQAEIRIENWNTLLGTGVEDAAAEIAKLQAEIDALRLGQFGPLQRARNEALAARNEAQQAVVDFRNAGTVRWNTSNWTNGGLGGFWVLENVAYLTVGELTINLTNAQNWLASAEETLAEYEKEFANASDSLLIFHTEMLEAQEALEAASRLVDTRWEALVVAQNAYNANPTQANQTALTAAQTAFNNAVTAQNAAIAALSEASNVYWTARNIVENWHRDFIGPWQQTVAWRLQNVQSIEAVLELLGEDAEIPAKLEAAFIEAWEAWIVANDNFNELNDEIAALQTMINDIRFLIYQTPDGRSTSISIESIEIHIRMEEESIADFTDEIARINRNINAVTVDAEASKTSLENSIASMKANIASLEVRLAAAQAQAAAAKAVMDERMN